MSRKIIKIPAVSDQKMVSAFRKIQKAIETPQGSINVLGMGTVVIGTENLTADVERILEIDSSIIEYATASTSGFTVEYFRGGVQSQNYPRSGIYDEFSIAYEPGNCRLSDQTRLNVLKIISVELRPLNISRTVGGGRSPEQEQLLAIHNSTLERLEALNEELIKGSEEFRRKIEADYLERVQKNDALLDERSKAVELAFQRKEENLGRREEELAKQLKEIDNRQNTHVRRELRKQILEEIRSRSVEFKLTAGTNKLRWPIHVIFILLIGALGCLVYQYAKQFLSALQLKDLYILSFIIGKQLLLSFAFGASVIFYIRWMHDWFWRHAATEFRLRQFQLDIERASWIVETALEWKDAKGGNIPPELLTPLTRNLFVEEEASPERISASDELASALLGTASRIRLNVAGSEVELDGKKLNKLKEE